VEVFTALKSHTFAGIKVAPPDRVNRHLRGVSGKDSVAIAEDLGILPGSVRITIFRLNKIAARIEAEGKHASNN